MVPLPAAEPSQGSRPCDFVGAYQQRMHERGWSMEGVDGIFGPQTDGVTRKFQKEKSLTIDGSGPHHGALRSHGQPYLERCGCLAIVSKRIGCQAAGIGKG